MLIRQANSNDANKIAPLFDQYRSFYKQPMDSKATVEFLRQRLSKNESTIFIYENDSPGVR